MKRGLEIIGCWVALLAYSWLAVYGLHQFWNNYVARWLGWTL